MQPLSIAVEVCTPSELFVEAGTDAKLTCSFTSSEEISPATSVIWSFLPEGSTLLPKPFFYYSDGKEYTGKNAPFSGQSEWVGNFDEKDASIKIANMQPADNGTYFCDVKNPPDIFSEPGQIEVKVWEKETTPVDERTEEVDERTEEVNETTEAVDERTEAVNERTEAVPEKADHLPENTTNSPRLSGGTSVKRALLWPLVFPFCCILASFASLSF